MSQRRYGLTDFEWSIIEQLLPNKPRVNDRRVLNGIYWRLRTGSLWADIPIATALTAPELMRWIPPTPTPSRMK